MTSPLFGVQTGSHSFVVVHIKKIIDNNRGGFLGNIFFIVDPGNVSFGDVTFAVGANGHEFGAVETGADIDQAMRIKRARHDGITLVIPTPPDFLAIVRIVGNDRTTGGADQLPLAIHFDQEGGY